LSANDAGQVAFAASVGILGAGIFLFSNGEISLLARQGDPAPDGGVLGFPSAPWLNNSGQVAFQAQLPDGNTGIFLYVEGKLVQIVRPGQPSPEADVFELTFTPNVNSNGQIAFAAWLKERVGGVYLFSEVGITRIGGQGDTVDRVPRFTNVDLSPAEINANGTVIFRAFSFPGATGLYDDSVAPIARQGAAAPDGGVFMDVMQPSVNDSGQVAFRARFAGFFPSQNSGLYLEEAGKVTKIARNGDSAPGGGEFSSAASPTINNASQIVFEGSVSAPGRSGLFLYSQGEIVGLVQQGDPAPGGGTFDTASAPWSNGVDQVVFVGSLQSPSRGGVFLWSEGTVSQIAQTGDPAPGGGVFVSFSLPTINSTGQVAFGAVVSGGQGVFLFSEGRVTKIVRSGDPAPGGGAFGFVGNSFLNDVGQVAFSGETGGTAVFLAADGEIRTIVRSGDPAPGGGTFSLGLPSPRINAAGKLTFASALSTGESGIFVAEQK
jgi:hypothetical protein